MNNSSNDSILRREPSDTAARARAIRMTLPGQVIHDRTESVRARYGALYTAPELRRRIAETLPSRFGYRRGAVLKPIEQYRDFIPDDALLKYDDAVQSGHFTTFWVATSVYNLDRQVDPWIVGDVAETAFSAVIAQWA